MKLKNLIVTSLFVSFSLSASSQNIAERLDFDSTFSSSTNSFPSDVIQSGGANVSYIENRFHEKEKAFLSQPQNSQVGGTLLIKRVDDLTNILDSGGVLSINLWWGINHPEAKQTKFNNAFGDDRIYLIIGNDTSNNQIDNPWYSCLLWCDNQNQVGLYDFDVTDPNSQAVNINLFTRNNNPNPLNDDHYWVNVHVEIKQGIDSSSVYIDGTLKSNFTASINDTISSTPKYEFLRVLSYSGLIDDLIIYDGALTASEIDSIANFKVIDSIVSVIDSKGSFWNYNDTLAYEIRLHNDTIFHDSLIMDAERGYHWQINLGNGWITHSTFERSIQFFNSVNSLYTPQQLEGGQIRCIVSGYGLDTSQTINIIRTCADTIIEHSPLVINIPLNSSAQIETSDQLGLALTKKWQISNYNSQGIYWSDLTNSNCQNCSGLNSDTLILNTPAIYNGRKFRKIISGCIDDTSDVFVLNLNNSCTNSQYSLPYYYPQDFLLAGYWNFNLDSIIQDETGNHCGVMTDSMSSFINDRSFLSNSALQANGAVYFSNPFDSVKLSNEFTLNFWHRTDSIGGGYVEYMRLYSPSTWGNNGAIEIGRHWNIGLAVKQGTTPFISTSYNSTLVPNTWTMLSVTYKNDSITLFINGIEMAKTDHTLNFYDDMYLKIPNENTGITGRRLDEMTFWYRAIDSRSLRNIYEGCIINEVFQEPNGALAYTTPGIASFSLKAYEDPSTTYQWEMNSGGASWITLSDNFQFNGTDKDSLFISNITAAMNNYSFRCFLNGCLSDTSSIVSLTVIDGIGIGESYNTEGSLYPNPTNGLIYIDQESITEYFVYNINGQLVAQGSTDSQIDITNLPAGIYQIVLAINEAISIHKIQKL